MNLMNLVRLLVLLVIGWTVAALGAGVLGVGEHGSAGSVFFTPRPSLEDAIPVGRLRYPGTAEYRLVDLTTGQLTSVTLPEREAWSLLCVSPWRDKDGNLEAAGRWVCKYEGEEEFCGIGCLTLPGLTVKKRITLDVLPIGRPLWLSGHPGEVLFPAGDGKLYRCNLAGPVGENRADGSRDVAVKNDEYLVKPQPVAWETSIPGTGVAFIGDPAGSSEPRLRHLIFVAIGVQNSLDGRRINLPTKLWWLVMNDEGDAIVNAGPLAEPGPPERDDGAIFERYPSVVIGAGGNMGLVYLSRYGDSNSWQLRSAKLEIDPKTALPRMQRRAGSNVLAENVYASPLVVSANGEYVHAVTGAGKIVKHPISR